MEEKKERSVRSRGRVNQEEKIHEEEEIPSHNVFVTELAWSQWLAFSKARMAINNTLRSHNAQIEDKKSTIDFIVFLAKTRSNNVENLSKEVCKSMRDMWCSFMFPNLWANRGNNPNLGQQTLMSSTFFLNQARIIYT